MTFYSRKSPRIVNYSYSSCNYYFVTICTHNRKCIFGLPNYPNAFCRIAEEEIRQISMHYQSVKIDHYIVMPNHIHAIIVLEKESHNLNQIIAQYKSGVSRRIHQLNPELEVWQRSYHDHVIRDQKSYEKIWLYIEANPMNWEKDCFYVDPTMGSAQSSWV